MLKMLPLLRPCQQEETMVSEAQKVLFLRYFQKEE